MARVYPESVAWSSIAETFRDYANRLGTPDLLVKLACGRVVARLVRHLKEEVLSTLETHSHSVLSKPGDRVDLPIDFRFLQQLLLAAEDPEIGLGDFSRGVRVGPGVRLPRLPALYAKKRRWRLPEQQPGQLEDLPTGEESPWQRNYSSAAPLEKQVVEVLEDHCARGQVRKYSEREAREKFPGLVVAALGAARKDKPDGEYTARVLFDGTNGIHVNKRIRLRDQERAPIAADIKRLMREKSRVGEKTFALSADVSEAHRQIPIAECDWRFLGCRVKPGGAVYVNTVGTFGVASASYWWSRVASALGRLTQYLAGHTARTWHLLVADDFHLEAGGSGFRVALFLFFLLCSVSGVPLSWRKTSGGDLVSWVGFELLHRSFQLGVTARRADWFTRWTQEVANERAVHMARFEEGLGRIAYVAGALEFERPFLAPLYKFLSMHPRNSTRRVPGYVAFFLRYLSQEVQAKRHCDCALELCESSLAPRVDAQASAERTGLGRWLPTEVNGKIDTWSSPWFSLEITRSDFPWIFEKGDSPSRVISTLEALAVLLSLKVFFGDAPPVRGKTKVMVAPTWTNNRGNGSVLNKLMTTKFPACAVVMELAAYLKKRSMKAAVQWAPRAVNQEADSLSKGDLEVQSSPPSSDPALSP